MAGRLPLRHSPCIAARPGCGRMTLIILARVILSVSASAIQKRMVSGAAGVAALWLATYALMLAPAACFAVLTTGSPPASFWVHITLGGLLDALGNLAMVAALRRTDLSIFGPLNAFRPVLALLGGWLFLGEIPSATGGAGIGVTLLGALLLLGERKESKIAPRDAAWVIGLRLGGLALSVAGAVFLKRASAQTSAEMTVTGWIAAGLACLAVAGFARDRHLPASVWEQFRAHPGWLVTHAAVFLVMQWLTIRIFQETLLAYSFVFFQLGMALQVIVGRALFREPDWGRRLAASAIMAAGSGLIWWKG